MDQIALAALEHGGQHRTGGVHMTAHVDVPDAFPFGVEHLDTTGHHDSGVGAEDVDMSIGSDSGIDHGDGVGFVCDIAAQTECLMTIGAQVRGHSLGGITIDVPKRMYYVDNAQGLSIDLYPGRQVLKGNDLEGFLRFRHDAMGDLGRMERQRLVLGQVFAKLAQPATLTKLPELMKILGDDILTDLSPIELTQLVSTMAHTKLSTERLPGRAYWQDDLSYWMPSSNHDHPSGGCNTCNCPSSSNT